VAEIGRAIRRGIARSAFALLGPKRFHRLAARAHQRKYGSTPGADRLASDDIVDTFHVLSYTEGPLYHTYWMGRPIQKLPLDCWVYQELIHELRPDVIVECGTYLGGSTLFFAQMCDLVGHGRVVTIDLERRAPVDHPRVRSITGDSTSDAVLAKVRAEIGPEDRVMVVLDSDHHAPHVARELRAYRGFVSLGSYLVVEDTNVNGHPVLPEHGPGPLEAVREFVAEDASFISDRTREKFLLSYFPEGWLKKVGP